MKVYVLFFADCTEDYEEYKNIGVYRSKESAEKVMYLDIQQRTSGRRRGPATHRQGGHCAAL